jgi:transposase
MSNKLVAMQQIRLLIHYLQKGHSQRKIAQQLGLSRNTIKLYADRIQASPLSLTAIGQLDQAALSALVYPSLQTPQTDSRRLDLSQRIPYFFSELNRTGVTRRLLWEEYKQQYPAGYSYGQFCERLSQDKKISQASMHFEYAPADMLLVDFAGDQLSYVDQQSGEVISCPVLVCVLPFSGYSYVVALPNASQPHLLKALNECLSFFGGIPANFKSDNMKQLVQKSCRYEPVFTQMIQQWALHNQITLLAARVRKPKDKAPVESEVKLAYQRIYAPLRDEVFFSLSALNQAILQQLAAHHQRPFQKKEANRYTRFMELEKPYLQSLPAQQYVMHHSVEAKVQKNYHIILGEDWHQYSVPFSYIGKKVQAIYDTDTVEIFYQHQRIVLHVRSYKKHGYSTIAAHMPQAHLQYQQQQGWTADEFLLQAEKIGPTTHAYMQQVLSGRRFTEQTYKACQGLMRLARSYGPERMEAACSRALQGHSYNYRTILNILSANLDKLQPTNQTCLFSLPAHDNLRGAKAYE